MISVNIRFYEELNDFLPTCRQKVEYSLKASAGQSIKDLIESENIPHTEIDMILVNGEAVDFTYRVRDMDRISVYPVFESLDITESSHLRPRPLRNPVFILDVHLGKLARYMRIAGFDSLYSNSYEDFEISEIASRDGRIVLTRDRGLLKRSIVKRGYWIRSQSPASQLEEIIVKFDPGGRIKPFTTCPSCNGILVKKPKKEIAEKLPEKTALYYNDFSVCSSCGKIYWKGSHFRKINQLLERIRRSTSFPPDDPVPEK